MTILDGGEGGMGRSSAMGAAEFRSTLAGIGLSEHHAARFLKVDEPTLRRWIAGREDVPPPLACRLRLMICPDIPPDMEWADGEA
ncbi:hypothetical protein [Labrys monachus]|uniref:DNA-binding transcriptional regulator YdaS (Cro superfamily) n=1 Tax=Labrys monachus TaxID=217067 RepID=A0ABU0F864_9HYPH|nr:hypothetical protein [Labrys monachus]MDQ0390806.1 DNA-binding transcriptional regulator YdaS (Cro superfamily) [Labrys monachus]